jgi:hypothetical protein
LFRGALFVFLYFCFRHCIVLSFDLRHLIIRLWYLRPFFFGLITKRVYDSLSYVRHHAYLIYCVSFCSFSIRQCIVLSFDLRHLITSLWYIRLFLGKCVDNETCVLNILYREIFSVVIDVMRCFRIYWYLFWRWSRHFSVITSAW